MNFPAGKKGEIAIYDAGGALVYKEAIGPFVPRATGLPGAGMPKITKVNGCPAVITST
jgi:hypothetical protein